MKTLIDLIWAHQVISGWIACGAVTIVSSSMPTPSPTDGKSYVIAFNILHQITGIFGRLPWYRSFFGLQENPTTLAGIAAKEDAIAIDPHTQGTSQAPGVKP
jgi:hypothetical protein